MPGLFGVIDTSGVRSPRRQQDLMATCRGMARAMSYDAAYRETLFSCASLGACVGWSGLTDGAATDRTDTQPRLVALVAGDAISSGHADPFAAQLIAAYQRNG